MTTFAKLKLIFALELVLLPLALTFSVEAHNTVGSHMIAVVSALVFGWYATEFVAQGERN